MRLIYSNDNPEPLVHLAIYVYNDGPPPEGHSTPIALCPGARTGLETLTDLPAQVTCPECREYWDKLRPRNHPSQGPTSSYPVRRG